MGFRMLTIISHICFIDHVLCFSLRVFAAEDGSPTNFLKKSSLLEIYLFFYSLIYE